jgi:hypothetical protein
MLTEVNNPVPKKVVAALDESGLTKFLEKYLSKKGISYYYEAIYNEKDFKSRFTTTEKLINFFEKLIENDSPENQLQILFNELITWYDSKCEEELLELIKEENIDVECYSVWGYILYYYLDKLGNYGYLRGSDFGEEVYQTISDYVERNYLKKQYTINEVIDYVRHGNKSSPQC